MNAESAPVVFLHIPKCGGTSLRIMLQNYYGGFLQLNGPDAKRPLADTLRMMNISAEDIRIYGGHIPFGLGEDVFPVRRHITMLRDPRERVISDFYYVARSPQHPLYVEIESGALTFGEFIRGKYCREVVTNRLYPTDPTDPNLFFPEVPGAELLAAAKQTLDTCVTVGICEEFERSVVVLQKVLDWSETPEILRHNATEERPRFNDLSDADQTAILDQTVLDRAVYDYAIKLFEKQCNALGVI